MSTLAVFAAAPSKVPFYVAGGALALWAVLLAGFGITRPGFPGSKGGRRGVIGASALLVVAAMGTAVATAGEEGEGEAAGTSSTFALVADPGGASSYNRAAGLVKPGAVTVHLTNDSTQDHNVAVSQGGRVLGESKIIKAGETELKLDLKPGEYDFFCEVDSHRAAGMEGKLTVR
jgi:plastocyanin